MMKTIFRKSATIAVFLLVILSSHAQDSDPAKKIPDTEKKELKPFKILTSGKKITVQSKISIKRIFVWTSSGHRIVEQHQLDVSSYTFTISINEKIFFMMVQTKDGKRYSEKFGVE